MRTLNVPSDRSPLRALFLAAAFAAAIPACLFRSALRAGWFLFRIFRAAVFFASVHLCLARYMPSFQRAGCSSPHPPRLLSPPCRRCLPAWSFLSSVLLRLRVPRFPRRWFGATAAGISAAVTIAPDVTSTVCTAPPAR